MHKCHGLTVHSYCNFQNISKTHTLSYINAYFVIIQAGAFYKKNKTEKKS